MSAIEFLKCVGQMINFVNTLKINALVLNDIPLIEDASQNIYIEDVPHLKSSFSWEKNSSFGGRETSLIEDVTLFGRFQEQIFKFLYQCLL